MINEENFAERLSQLREARQVSAREMSLAIGQNCSYINRIENKKAFLIIPGLSEPPVRTLRATIPENESHIFR